MIGSAGELFEAVGELAAELRRLGDEQAARDLAGALAASTLPGEVLGEVRVELLKVEQSRAAQTVHVRAACKEAIAYIDRVLGG